MDLKTFKIMLLAIIAVFAFAITAVLYLDKSMKEKNPRKRQVKKKHIFKTTTYLKWYKRFDDFFLTRGGLRKIHSRIVEMSIYDPQEIKINTVECFVLTKGISVAAVIASVFLFKSILMFLCFLIFAVVLNTSLIDKQIDKVHLKIMKALLHVISSIIDNYQRTDSIPDAFAEAEVPDILKRSMDQITTILTANDGDKKLEEFYASTPYRLLQTLAGTAYILADSGDTKTATGSSNFLDAMRMINEEVRLEIRRITKQKASFGILEVLPIAALLLMPVVMGFFKTVIPGTSVFYNSLAGNLSKILILIMSLIGYVVIVKVNSAVAVKADDRSSLIMKMLQIPWFMRIVKDVTPKKTYKLRKKRRVLKNSLTMTNMSHLYAQKVIYAGIALVLSIIFLWISVYTGRDYIYSNYTITALMGGEELTPQDMAKRIEMDNKLMEYDTLPPKEELGKVIKGSFPKLLDTEVEEQVNRVTTKYKSYKNAYFKWWMLLVCYGIGFIGWCAPELMLKWRTWILKSEAEEDVLQLQTMIAILMNTSVDILDTLYWLMKQSRIHKGALMDALHEYPSNPDLALARLKETASIVEFKRMVDKLKLTVHQIELKSAFSDLSAERQHILEIREISQDTSLKKKRSAVSPLSLAPAILVAVLLLLAPILVLGIQEFMTAFSSMQM